MILLIMRKIQTKKRRLLEVQKIETWVIKRNATALEIEKSSVTVVVGR